MKLKDVISGALGETAAGGETADLSSLVSGLLPDSGASFQESLKAVSKELEGLTSVSQIQSEVVGSNTQAVLNNTVAQSSGGLKDAASTIGKAASSFLTGGLGMIPVVAAVRSLFSGGQSEPAPLVKYSPPAPIRIEATASGEAIYGPRVSSSTNTSGPYAGAAPSGQAPSANPTSAQQITIQVQAMDSQSFMDHSGDIARAVREAMLNMHSLNDLINEG